MSSWGEEGLKTRWMERKRGRQAREDVEIAEVVVREGQTGPLSTDMGSDHDPRMLPGDSIRSLSLHPFTLQLLRSQEANAAALGASLDLFHLPDDGLGASLRPQPLGQLWSSQAWLLRGPLRQ